MPVFGSLERSAAITGTAPRKNPKGEVAMRANLMGKSLEIRPRCALRSKSTTPKSRRLGVQSPWLTRLTSSRRDWPNFRRSSWMDNLSCFVAMELMHHTRNCGLGQGFKRAAPPSWRATAVTFLRSQSRLPCICATCKSRCCLLYTSDAADEEDSVDLGGR